MFKKKRFLVSLLALILLLALAACSSNQETADKVESTTPSNESTGNSEGSKETEDLTPVTFTYFNAGFSLKDIEANQTRIGKIFEEQTGVNFKMEYLVGDINTKVGTMIASGEYPDVIVPDATIDKLIEAEALIPLNDLIDQYAPNLKKLYGPYLEQMKTADGNIYIIPFGANQGYLPLPTIDQGAFWIQRGVLKEFGYPKIKTLDEYMNLIEQYAAKYPQIDGKPTIGFTALTYDWRFFAFSNTPNHLAGYPNDGGVIVDMQTNETNVYADDEITKRYLKKLFDMNQKGLFDKEAFVANYDEYLAKVTSGRVLGFFDYGWQVQQALNNLEQAGDDDKRYMPLPIVFDENIKDQYLDPPAFVSNRGIAITVSAKDPVRIIKYFDNLVKEENQKLVFWGIPGETYEVDENGRFYRTEEQLVQTADQQFREEFGFAYFEWSWPRGDGIFSDGNAWEPRRQPEVALADFTDGDRAILEAYGVKTFSELFAEPEERPWYPAWSVNIEQGSPAQIFSQKSTDLTRKYFPRIVLAESADAFEKEWNDYINEFNKLDVKAYEETMNQLIKERIKAVKGE